MVELKLYQTGAELESLGRKVMESRQMGISVREGSNIFDIFRYYRLSEEVIKHRKKSVREKHLPTNIFLCGEEVYFSIYGEKPFVVGIRDVELTKRMGEYLGREKIVNPENLGIKPETTIDSCCF